MTRRKQRHEPHVRLYRHELECEAYRSLTPEARALLIELRAFYSGKENRVYMSVREMMNRLGIGRRRSENARDELIDRGFIYVLTQGSFSRKGKHATEYALANEPLENTKGAVAPKDFMRWRQKNTVYAVNTDGVHSEHRGQGTNARNPALGVHSEHREGQTDHTHGVHSEHTDMLPSGGEIHWLAEYGGWPCSKKYMDGAILDTCCLICGVWTTSGGYEFDGQKHSCNPVDRAKYRERRRLVAGESDVAA